VLSAAGYHAGGAFGETDHAGSRLEVVAYIEPLAVGDPLPDMPLFLTPGDYVPCPLEATYGTTWDQYPTALQGALENPAES